MKSLWIPCTILITLFLLLHGNSLYLHQLATPLQSQLEEAKQCVKDGDWETATKITRQVHDTWHNHAAYLHTPLRHSDIDTIYVLLEEVLAYLENQKIGEYSAANATLISQLGLLYEMEQLSLQNIL